MALDKNVKIKTSSNFNFVMNGKKIESFDDLPQGLKTLGSLFGSSQTDFVNTVSKNNQVEKIATLMQQNPEFLNLMKSGKLKFDSLTKTVSYNGKVINILEELPAPLRPIAKKFMEDHNGDQIPDILEGVLSNPNKQTNATIETKTEEPITYSRSSSNLSSLPKTSDNKVIENKPINVAGNPISSVQVFLVVVTILGALIYFSLNA